MREIKFRAWDNKKKKWEDSIDITLVDKKKLFARLCYSIGILSTQFLLLTNHINETNKSFSEFDKWFKKIQKEKIIELRNKTTKHQNL